MTPKQLAQEYLYDLYSDADAVRMFVENARTRMDGGHAAECVAELDRAVKYIDRLAMRLQDAKRHAALVREGPTE